MQISNIGRAAVFYGQQQPNNAEEKSSIMTRRPGVMASEQFRDEDEDGINTDREFNTDKHMPLEFLEAVRESMRYFTDLTRKFVIENGAVRTPQDEEKLEDFLRNAPKIENGFTYDELIELSSR